VPDLESEEDVGYFDDFSNEEDMAKYKEVYEKQLELSKLADRSAPLNKSAFVGFTFRYHLPKIAISRHDG
jgi:cell cycle protein kinase DBF2